MDSIPALFPMTSNSIVVRKESFGGILGRRESYGFHAINHATFEALQMIAALKKSPTDTSDISGNPQLLHRLQTLGFLDDTGQARLEIIDNGNNVQFLSAPIRVWLEVTSKCNLSCRECFNEQHQAFKDDLSLLQIKSILNDLHRSGVLQLTITGGEPLLRRDIWEILDHAFELGFGVRFFTNGTTLNEANSARLSQYPISHLFASMDGTGDINDALRGSGTFSRISKGIIQLAKTNKNITLSVTLHAQSVKSLASTFDYAVAYGIRSLLIRPLLQYTDASNSIMVKTDKMLELLAALEHESKRTGIEYQLNKLPFLENKKTIYVHDKPTDVHFSYFTDHNQFGCVGGNTVVGIKSNGAVMACGFVPHDYDATQTMANGYPFLNLWNTASNITVLRDQVANEQCAKCPLLSVCGGGCRANALLRNKSLTAVDPYCFWGSPSALPTPLPDVSDAKLLREASSNPYISERTIVTKCGSGSLL
jgi:mycofactocin biosynthetic radical S-adenosylmethionine protein MftC